MAKAAKKEQEEPQQKRCFIITPIGNDDSNIRRETDGLIDAVILPTLEKLGIKGEVAHRINKSGNINNQVINCLIEYELVIANLTGLNPNVMYELAIRHAKRKPVVSLAAKGTNLPFDIHAERTLMYVNDMAGVEDLKPQLVDAIKEAIEEENPNNPVYDAVTDNIMKDFIEREGTEKDKIFFEQLEDIRQEIRDLRNNSKIGTGQVESDLSKTKLYVPKESVDEAIEILSNNNIRTRKSSISDRISNDYKLHTQLYIIGFNMSIIAKYSNVENAAVSILNSHGINAELH